MEYVTLNNGVKMPLMGYGVYQIRDAAEAERCVLDAIDAGYRHIDTAAVYGNEEAVGKAIRKCGVPREELFITTKLWIADYGYEKAKKAFETSLNKLGLDYVDLYLLHKPYNDYYGAWRAVEELYKEGKIRAIGVTSFWNERLADLMSFNEITPAVNQVDTNVFNQQWESQKFMNEQGIVHEAWAPFAEGQNGVFKNPVLQAIGDKYGKTTGQVMLRWLIQRNIPVIPKTVHKERMIENMNVFDFRLSEEDMELIRTLDTGKSVIYDEMNPAIVMGLAKR